MKIREILLCLVFQFQQMNGTLKRIFGSVLKVGSLRNLSKNIIESKQEEFWVTHTSEISSKVFDFCIEGFCKCICWTVFKEIENIWIVHFKSSSNCSKRLKSTEFYWGSVLSSVVKKLRIIPKIWGEFLLIFKNIR